MRCFLSFALVKVWAVCVDGGASPIPFYFAVHGTATDPWVAEAEFAACARRDRNSVGTAALGTSMGFFSVGMVKRKIFIRGSSKVWTDPLAGGQDTAPTQFLCAVGGF